MRRFATHAPGIGGRLRAEPDDFRVVELGDGPRRSPEGRFTAARIRLTDWETNRFVGLAARRLGVKPGSIGFAGMKDKRAVTEQWFTFQASEAKVNSLRLGQVEILETHRVVDRMFAGAHQGNRFEIAVDGADVSGSAEEATKQNAQTIRDEMGVPRYFGPQRFGAFRPITHLVGQAIVKDDLEEAVRLYLGNPIAGEREEALAARKVYEETRDPEAALAAYPDALDFERRMLRRLIERPDWGHALHALPGNLLTLFIHAYQSWVFNHIVSARLDEGWGLREVRIGDRVCATDEDGTRTHLVNDWNRERVQREVDKGRAAATGILPGLEAPPAEGAPGELEAKVMAEMNVDLKAFRCFQMPRLASPGRRRTVLQPVRDLEVVWGDKPRFSFALGKGDYATTVMREFMKVDVA